MFPSSNNIVKNEDIGRPPILLQLKVENVYTIRSERNSSKSEDKLCNRVNGVGKGVNEADKQSPNVGNINPD